MAFGSEARLAAATTNPAVKTWLQENYPTALNGSPFTTPIAEAAAKFYNTYGRVPNSRDEYTNWEKGAYPSGQSSDSMFSDPITGAIGAFVGGLGGGALGLGELASGSGVFTSGADGLGIVAGDDVTGSVLTQAGSALGSQASSLLNSGGAGAATGTVTTGAGAGGAGSMLLAQGPTDTMTDVSGGFGDESPTLSMPPASPELSGPPSMPGAMPENPATLQDWGLAETAPGVFTAAGAANSLAQGASSFSGLDSGVAPGVPAGDLSLAGMTGDSFTSSTTTFPSPFTDSGIGAGWASSGPTSLDEYLQKLKGMGKAWAPWFNIGKGAYGLYQANQIKNLASKAQAAADPFASQRPQYQAQLSALASNPNAIFNMPGYKAGETAVNRGMAASGYLNSGNQMAALQQYGGKFYSDEMARLASLSGANINPSGAAGAVVQGTTLPIKLAGEALNSMAYGAMNL